MKIPQYEADILKQSFCKLHDAYHNIHCLFIFLKREYPENATIEYTVLLNGLLRMQEIENVMGVSINYPVFGKEKDMADPDRLKNTLKNILNVDRYGFIDLEEPVKDGCINADLHLYEVPI